MAEQTTVLSSSFEFSCWFWPAFVRRRDYVQLPNLAAFRSVALAQHLKLSHRLYVDE